MDISITKFTVLRSILDALMGLFFAITVIIVLAGGFHFYIGTYLISARSLLVPLGIWVILAVVRLSIFGNPFSNFSIHHLRDAARYILDLLILFFALISIFIVLSGGVQFNIGDNLVSARSLVNPVSMLLIFVVVRSWLFGIPLQRFVTRLVSQKWGIRQWAGLALSISFVAAISFLANYWFMKQGSLLPPPPGTSLTTKSSKITEGLPRGFVVWSSNRHGNHDILKMDLPSKRITPLTKHPHSEYFPRISPDGTKIVFARSQRPWVPHRNQLHWDIILMDLESGKQRVLAKSGNTPNWSVDGKKVHFQRNAISLVEIDIKTQKEQILFTSGVGQVRKNVILQTPHFSHVTNQLAVTLRRNQNQTSIVDLDGSLTTVARGCQLTWSKKGDFLYYINHPGHKENALYLYDPVKKQSKQWLDLPGELSHEYFPKLSNDERYLVLGASEGGRKAHEHDTSDYEIFVWKVGTSADKATRLTHHTGNDNWPDIFIY
ncbi:hypothetical protein ACFL17_04710 [Pseudomonadota bacterium]